MATVSVIIPVYNTAEYLEACLISVQHQTFGDFEAIIVNDGSTDNSQEIIDWFVERDSRFSSLLQENAGLSEARNSGLKKATAPWITFVDSDDMIAPTFLEVLLDAAKENADADMVCCGANAFAELPAKIPGNKKFPVRTWTPAKALARALYQDRIPDHSAWNKLYSAKLWKDRQFPKGKYFEDLCVIPSVILESNCVCAVESPLYLYRKRDTSILRTAYDLKKAELLDIAEEVCEMVKEHGDAALLKAAQNMVISTSYSILKRTPDTDEFKDYRNRAWNNIKTLRIRNLLDSNVRLRNKIANLVSFCGYEKLCKTLERHQ